MAASLTPTSAPCNLRSRGPGRVRMSGSNEARGDDGPPKGSSVPDICSRKRRGPINSPKADVLSTVGIGSKLNVDVRIVGSTEILVVETPDGRAAGSLTFVGYVEIIRCIVDHGYAYGATILNVSGGVYEVVVERA